MNKVHLNISYGADERYSLVRNTILTHHKYFECVRVWNSGPDENIQIFDNLIKHVPNLKIYSYGDTSYHMTNPENVTRAFCSDVPDGEWIAYLDSDWRMSEIFLQNMSNEISVMESEGINHLFSSQLPHHLGPAINDWEATKMNYTQEQIDEIIKHTSTDTYGQPLLQRVDKKNIWCDSFIGNHGYMLHVPYNKKHVRHMYHYHIRDYSEGGYCQTMVPLSWWYPGHHAFTVEYQVKVQESWEYKHFEQFKEDYKCYTSNELFKRIKNNDTRFLDDMRKLFLSFKDSELFFAQQMYTLASKCDMKFYRPPAEEFCTGVCCLYDGKYIKDYPKI